MQEVQDICSCFDKGSHRRPAVFTGLHLNPQYFTLNNLTTLAASLGKNSLYKFELKQHFWIQTSLLAWKAITCYLLTT